MVHTFSVLVAPETPLVISSGMVTPDESNRLNGAKKTYMCGTAEMTEFNKLIEETYYVYGKMHGMQYKWHANGALAFAGEFKEGKPIGPHITYHSNGNKHIEVNYKDGILNGTIKECFKDGRVHKEGECIDGKLHGMYFEYSHSGAIMVACFFENGALIRRAF